MTQIDSTASVCFITTTIVAGLFVTILGLCLLLRGSSFYGSLRDFLKNVLAWLSLAYFVIILIFLLCNHLIIF